MKKILAFVAATFAISFTAPARACETPTHGKPVAESRHVGGRDDNRGHGIGKDFDFKKSDDHGDKVCKPEPKHEEPCKPQEPTRDDKVCKPEPKHEEPCKPQEPTPKPEEKPVEPAKVCKTVRSSEIRYTPYVYGGAEIKASKNVLVRLTNRFYLDEFTTVKHGEANGEVKSYRNATEAQITVKVTKTIDAIGSGTVYVGHSKPGYDTAIGAGINITKNFQVNAMKHVGPFSDGITGGLAIRF
jgi:outer membrane biosynthesis protein TonB